MSGNFPALAPDDPDRPPFTEPWQAGAFALTMALYEGGVFTWAEWTEALVAAIARAQAAGDPDTGETYYHHWLAALETLVAAKELSDPATLARYRAAWERAAARTPHGQPILLEPADLAG